MATKKTSTKSAPARKPAANTARKSETKTTVRSKSSSSRTAAARSTAAKTTITPEIIEKPTTTPQTKQKAFKIKKSYLILAAVVIKMCIRDRFWTVLNKIENTYYDKKAIDPQKLLNGAIAGMVASLDDPYTVYLPPAQNKDFKQGLAGQFEGIGAELGMKGKQIIVVAPLDGGPAQKAGVRAGDMIIKVDDQAIGGWNLNQVVSKIRGEKGTDVRLSVMRQQDQQPRDLSLIHIFSLRFQQ